MSKSYDSQQQAAAALGIDREMVRQAKRDGCSAFKSGRIYHEPLAEWIAQRTSAEPCQSAALAAQPPAGTEAELRLRERRHAVELAEFKLAAAKGDVLPLAEYQAALRVLLGGFDAVLKQIPGRAADKLMHRSRLALAAMLRAELTAKQFERIEPLLKSAPVDHAGVVEILDTEIEACRRVLAEADFMEPEPETA